MVAPLDQREILKVYSHFSRGLSTARASLSQSCSAARRRDLLLVTMSPVTFLLLFAVAVAAADAQRSKY